MTELVLVGIKTELHTSEFGRFSLCKIVRKNVIYTKNCRFDNIVNRKQLNREKKVFK